MKVKELIRELQKYDPEAELINRTAWGQNVIKKVGYDLTAVLVARVEEKSLQYGFEVPIVRYVTEATAKSSKFSDVAFFPAVCVYEK